MNIRYGILGILLMVLLSTDRSNAVIELKDKLENECKIHQSYLQSEYRRYHEADFWKWQRQVKRRYDVARVLADVANLIQDKLRLKSSDDETKTKLNEIRESPSALAEFKEDIDFDWAYVRLMWNGMLGFRFNSDIYGLKANEKFQRDKESSERYSPRFDAIATHDYIDFEDTIAEWYKTIKDTTILVTSSGNLGFEACYYDKYAKRSFGLPKRNCIIIDLTANGDTPHSELVSQIQKGRGQSHLIVSAKSDKRIRPADILVQMLHGLNPEAFPAKFLSPDLLQPMKFQAEFGPGYTRDSKYPWASCENTPLSNKAYLQCASSVRCGGFKKVTIADPSLDEDRSRFLLDLVGLHSAYVGETSDYKRNSGGQ